MSDSRNSFNSTGPEGQDRPAPLDNGARPPQADTNRAEGFGGPAVGDRAAEVREDQAAWEVPAVGPA